MKLKTHRNSKKFNTQEYEQCRENLKSFIAKISKIEEKNFITLKELQNEFNLVMDNFPTNQEIMTLFDNIYQRYF